MDTETEFPIISMCHKIFFLTFPIFKNTKIILSSLATQKQVAGLDPWVVVC